MNRITGPVWRIVGAAVSWALFTFSFALLFLSASVVMGLGGFCASGGPYVIAVECPPAVAALTPLSIFGGLIAVGLSLVFARGFGMPLAVWSWPILFVGLGTAFALAGGVTFVIIAVLFVGMGLVPLVLELRASPQRTFLGTTDATDRRFAERDSARRSIFATGEPNPEGADRPTGGAWALGLGIPLVAIALGLYLALTLFAAVSRVPQ